MHVCLFYLPPYSEPVVVQWHSSGNPVCLELRPQCTLECHWRKKMLVASVLPVVFHWSFSSFPVVFQCVPTMQINTGSPLGHQWVLASTSVVPVASQCTLSPVVFQCVPIMQINTGLPLEHHWELASASVVPVYLWLQWSFGVVCPVVSQCIDRIWFGGH